MHRWLGLRTKALPVVLLAATVLIFSGCGKKPAVKTPESAPEQAPVKSPEPVAANAPRVVPVTVVESPDASAQLAQLTQLVRRFGMDRQRVPQSLNELVAAGYLAGMPSAPAGKQFVIDPKHMQVLLQ